MFKKIVGKVAVGVVLSGLSLGASADMIGGSLGLAGSLRADDVGDIVSDMTFFQLEGMAPGGGSTSPVSSPASMGGIDLNSPGGIIYEAGGMAFELLAVEDVVRSERTCQSNACFETITVRMSGTVSGPGVDAQPWLGRFSATGACLMAGDACRADTKSAAWSASIVSPALSVASPGTLLLVALGLLGVYARRRV